MSRQTTPLSAYIDGTDYITKPQKFKKNPGIMWIGAFLLALLPSLSTTFASSIAINGTNPIEFGQGSQATAVCDDSITVQIGTTYDNLSSTFKASAITLGDIDTSACLNKTLTVKALDTGGNPLDLNGNGPEITYTPTQVSGPDGIDEVTLTITGTINSVDIARVTVETA
jgi:hypothetical protein